MAPAGLPHPAPRLIPELSHCRRSSAAPLPCALPQPTLLPPGPPSPAHLSLVCALGGAAVRSPPHAPRAEVRQRHVWPQEGGHSGGGSGPGDRAPSTTDGGRGVDALILVLVLPPGRLRAVLPAVSPRIALRLPAVVAGLMTLLLLAFLSSPPSPGLWCLLCHLPVGSYGRTAFSVTFLALGSLSP